jgi:hypothetical protein
VGCSRGVLLSKTSEWIQEDSRSVALSSRSSHGEAEARICGSGAGTAAKARAYLFERGQPSIQATSANLIRIQQEAAPLRGFPSTPMFRTEHMVSIRSHAIV